MYKVISENLDKTGDLLYKIKKEDTGEYFLLPEKYFEVLRYINVPFNHFNEIMKERNTEYSEADYAQIISYFKSTGLMVNPMGSATQKSLLSKLIYSYFYVRFPLFKPDGILNQTKLIWSLFCSRFVIIILSLLSLFGYVFAIRNYDLFYASASKINLEHLLPLLMGWMFLKGLHELGHCITAKYYGIEVRKFGVALIFLTPRFYSDVTDSVTLDKEKRLKISSAGIVVEIILGGLAAILFLGASPGSFLSIMSGAIVITAIASTILFNANPFMRFDGYYMLADALDEPILYENGQQNLQEFMLRLFGCYKSKNIYLKYLIYGALAWVYKIFLYTSIIMFLYITLDLKILSISLCLLEVLVLFIKPLIAFAKKFISSQKKSYHLITNSLILGVFIFGILLPNPIRSKAFSLVSRSEIKNEVIIAPAEGYMSVESGSLIFNNKVEELTKRLYLEKLNEIQLKIDSNQKLMKMAEIGTLKKLENTYRQQLNHLDSKARKISLDNKLFVKDIDELNGKYYKEGEIVTSYLSDTHTLIFFKEKPDLPLTGDLISKHALFASQNITINEVSVFNDRVPKSLNVKYGGFIECNDDEYALDNYYVANINNIQIPSQLTIFKYDNNDSILSSIIDSLRTFIYRTF